MTIPQRVTRPLLWSVAILSIALAIACGSTGKDSRAPIFGGGDPGAGPLSRPQVILTVPATSSGATAGVATNAAVTATFSKDMAPASIGGTSFTLAGPGVTPVTGTVTYAAGSRTATFTPSALLTANTTYTATVTTGATDVAGNQLAGNQAAFPAASNYVWTFTTSLVVDITRPRAVLTVPATTVPGPTPGVATNTAINALFTEDMAPGTLTGSSFTVTGPGVTPVTGTVSYAQRTATFAPSAVLLANTTYTATLTTAVTDLAGNQLAGNQAALPAASAYIWTFTTGAATDLVQPTIILTSPANAVTGVVVNTNINATFSKAMNPATINSATFTVQASGPPAGALLQGVVSYDPLTRIATFNPSANLASNTTYTATISGPRDLAGNALASGIVPNPWTFTTGSGSGPGAVALGSAGTFGIMATSAITSTGRTIINGDVALAPGTNMTITTPGLVNGSIHINDAAAAAAHTDLVAAYAYAKGLPPGTTVTAGADLGAAYPLGIPPGTYTSGSTILVSTPLIMDARGNTNAVWVFQIGSSLTTTSTITLVNGAQAKNIFWVPTSDATIGVNSIFYGTIVTGRDATAKTGAVINGRILSGAATAGTIALDTNTVNVPAP